MGLKIRLSSDMRLNRFVTTCYNGVGMRYELGDAPDVSDAATRETSPAKIVRQYCSQPAASIQCFKLKQSSARGLAGWVSTSVCYLYLATLSAHMNISSALLPSILAHWHKRA